MPVEQGLPWHPVATGLAGQAIPFVVAAFYAHALPSPPFRFPAVLVASPASLCPSSLSAVLPLVPPGVAPAFCVAVLLLPLSVGAPGCPCCAPPLLSHPPAPPYKDFTSPYDVDCPVHGWLVTALLPPPWRAPPGARVAAPALVEYVGYPPPPPCVQRTIKSSKNTVRKGMFVRHAVRYPIHSVRKPSA